MKNSVAALDAEVLPLSFAQQRLWFLDQLDPGKPLYNIPLEIYFDGRLNVAALERSFNEIVRRHEVLRTTFRTVSDQPVQVIAPSFVMELPVTDLTSLPVAERRAETRRLADEEAGRPFDLSRGPLLRASLLRLGEEEHALLVTMHHIVTDGWSVNVLKAELGALYGAYSEGRESPLEELPIQYADFAAWQREWLQGEVLEEQLSFWRQHLEGAPPLLLLPTDKPRPAVRSYRGASIHLTLDAELVGALRGLSRQEGGTVFMTLLAAYQVLLARHSGQQEVVVGTPIANRHREEVEGLIGFFVNTLALRAELRGGLSFRELLRQVRGRALSAYEHQDVPFERLVEELRPERSLSHSPLFQVLFALHNTPMEADQFAGLTVTLRDGETGTSKYDLVLALEEKDGGLEGDFKYSTDLFTVETAERMMARFEVLLRAVAADPDKRVADLSLLTEAERRQLLFEFNETAVEYEPECLHQLFERQAAQTPNAVAVAYEDEELTYAELDERVNQLAHHLRTLGVGSEVLVGLFMQRSVEMVVALLAVLKAGGAYLPLDPEYPRERLAFMLADSGARVLLTQSSLRASVPESAAEVFVVDDEWKHVAAANPTAAPRTEVLPQNLAYVIYTSGSTGAPKGVMISHGSVCNLLNGLDRAVYAEAGGAPLCVGVNGSIAFDTSVKQLIQLLNGHALRLLPEDARRDGEALLKYLGSHRVDVLDCTPSMLSLLLGCGLLDAPEALPRLVLVGGEAIDPTTWETLSGVTGADFYNVYGPTECTVDATVCRIGEDAPRPSIGRPIANCRVYVLDRRLAPVPQGVTGELYVGGVGVARGYLGRPSLTAERFMPDPFSTQTGARLYRTGDLARHLADGSLEYLGRADGQVKVRGHRIELGEVEAALGRCAGVRECAVAAREDGPGGRRLVAYVVAEDESLTTAEQLRGYLRERLPGYMMPAAFVLLDALPLTPNGKVDRAALPDPEASRLAPGGEFVAPRTPDEEAVAAIWREVLQVERVGVTDNFFDLGGHSLLATQVLSKLRKRLGTEVALRTMFAVPTVEALAAEVGRGVAAQPPAIQRLARDRYLMTTQQGGQVAQD